MHPDGIYSDKGTVLNTDEAALVTENSGTTVSLLLPIFKDEDTIPRAILYLVACAMRSSDEPDFIEEQIQWLTNRKRQAN
jgi:hypothetical protein